SRQPPRVPSVGGEYANLSPFWKFRSSTTKRVCVLENSRNIQKFSVVSRAFFWRGSALRSVQVSLLQNPHRRSISAVSRYICCTAAYLTQKMSDGSLSRRRRR